MPRMRNPAHLQANPVSGASLPCGGNHFGGDHAMKALAAFWLRFLMLAAFALIPASLSGETNQDSEPFLAVQAVNPQIMVASAFTPNPFSASGNAPVYISE